ncbi:efflux RND transporter periplasmic adaptor subunit [Marinibacterium sp. SX1]|uniref:efflux RND transporter periplasmic adaptor subunit n=1 Tax=Marinibacterium sp. SX1 TaxID=3388424 RepID=UPI003D185C7D
MPHLGPLHRFLLAVPILALGPLAPALPARAQDAPAPAGETVLAVTAVTAEVITPLSQHVLIGEITAPETVQASFPVGGRLTDVMVQVGDQVAPGDTLARIEQVQQVQALRAAEARLSAAEAEFTAAESQSERQAELFERGATTRSDRDQASDRYAAAVATRTQAQASLDQARQALDDTVLTAGARATVTDRFGEPGQVVGAAQPVLELAVGPGFEAKFNVPEGVLTAAQTAPQTVTLSGLDRPGVTVMGRLKEISPLVDAARGTVEVTVTLDEPLPGLTYGDAVRGATAWTDDPQIVLPWSAISSGTDGPSVWIVDPADDTVSEHPITIGRYSEHRVMVADGVTAGQVVVTRGAQLLYPGRQVRIVEPSE